MTKRDSINQALKEKWIDNIIDNVDSGIELRQAYIRCDDKSKKEKLLTKMLNSCRSSNDIISVMDTVSLDNKKLPVIDIQPAIDKYNEFYLKDIEKAAIIEDVMKAYSTYGIYTWAKINNIAARKTIDLCNSLPEFKRLYDFAKRFGEEDYAKQKWDAVTMASLGSSTGWKSVAHVLHYARQGSEAEKNAIIRCKDEVSKINDVYEAKKASCIGRFRGFVGHEIVFERWEELFLEKLPELNSLEAIEDFYYHALIANNYRTRSAEHKYMEKWGEMADKVAKKCTDFDKLWEIYKHTHYDCKSVRVKILEKLVLLCKNEKQAEFLYNNTDNIFDTNRHVVVSKLVEMTSDLEILKGIYSSVERGFFPKVEEQVVNKLELVLNKEGCKI